MRQTGPFYPAASPGAAQASASVWRGRHVSVLANLVQFFGCNWAQRSTHHTAFWGLYCTTIPTSGVQITIGKPMVFLSPTFSAPLLGFAKDVSALLTWQVWSRPFLFGESHVVPFQAHLKFRGTSADGNGTGFDLGTHFKHRSFLFFVLSESYIMVIFSEAIASNTFL